MKCSEFRRGVVVAAGVDPILCLKYSQKVDILIKKLSSLARLIPPGYISCCSTFRLNWNFAFRGAFPFRNFAPIIRLLTSPIQDTGKAKPHDQHPSDIYHTVNSLKSTVFSSLYKNINGFPIQRVRNQTMSISK